jgi:hypothetical protein
MYANNPNPVSRTSSHFIASKMDTIRRPPFTFLRLLLDSIKHRRFSRHNSNIYATDAGTRHLIITTFTASFTTRHETIA